MLRVPAGEEGGVAVWGAGAVRMSGPCRGVVGAAGRRISCRHRFGIVSGPSPRHVVGAAANLLTRSIEGALQVDAVGRAGLPPHHSVLFFDFFHGYLVRWVFACKSMLGLPDA